MNRSILLFALVLILNLSDYSQSGRKITSSTAATIDKNEDSSDFSESIPQKTRKTDLTPTFRSVERAQKSPDESGKSNTANSSPAEEEIVKVQTDLITIPVSVYDRNGLYIPNLTQKNFKIFENGTEQEIAYFGTTDKPFTVILLLDSSPSTQYKIEDIQQAAMAFVNQLKPEDRVMVIEFAMGVHVLTEAKQDRQQIFKAIKKADFGQGTALYDAVDFSLRKRLAGIEGRKAVVLFTDGVDTSSRNAGYDSTLDEAEESDALVFPIYYNTFFDQYGGLGGINAGNIPLPGRNQQIRGGSSEEYALGRKYLDELSAYTGGRVFRPESTPGGLTAAFEGIAEELRRQYSIGYIPLNEGKPGQRKQIKIRVDRPNLVVRNRDSYIVGNKKSSSNAVK